MSNRRKIDPARLAHLDQIQAAGRDRFRSQAPVLTRVGIDRPADVMASDLLAAVRRTVTHACAHVTAAGPFEVPSIVVMGAGLWLCDPCATELLADAPEPPDNGLCDKCGRRPDDQRFHGFVGFIGVTTVIGHACRDCAARVGVAA
jgi:hypothetical protein